MSKHKILFMSDLNFKGSGYYNISVNLLDKFVAMGHEAIAVGWNYEGNEHDHPYAIVPSRNIQETFAVINNIWMEWKPEALVVAMDIPMHLSIKKIFDQRRFSVPYYAIFPLESPPLPTSWAMSLMSAKGRMCMTNFGTADCLGKGLKTTYFPIGIDQSFWKLGAEGERKAIRDAFKYGENDFVILTVADNQERKNLTASMNIVAKFRRDHPELNVHYHLVTREHLPVGYLLMDYAVELQLANNLSIFERGMPLDELRRLYISADAFLLTSKSEGLGLPVLEAMSTGLPVVAANCCSIQEHLSEGLRGFPIKIKTSYRDSFGNGMRYLVDENDGARQLTEVLTASPEKLARIKMAAKDYIASFSYEESAQILSDLLDEEKI